MSHKVRVAILATITVLLLAGLAFGQTYGQPAGYVVGPAEESTQEVEAPEVTPPTSVTPVAELQRLEGPQGPQGPAGPPGTPGRTIVREGHQGHQDPYREIKSWNPAAVSFVETRDERTRQEAVREANAYAEGLLSGARSQTEQENNEDLPPGDGVNWWIPLQALSILAILSVIGYALWRWWRDRTNIRNRDRMNIRNTASVIQFGQRLRPAEISSTNDGDYAVSIQKSGANLSRGSGRVWAQSSQTIEVPHTPGDLLEFVVSVTNNRPLPVSANGIMMVDWLVNASAVPGSGRVYAGRRLLGILPDEILSGLVSGQTVDLATIVDRIPAANDGLGRINLLYRVDTTPAGYREGDQTNVPPVGGGGQAAPVGPLFTIGEPAAAEVEAPATEPEPAEPAAREEVITAEPAAVAAEADRLVREGQTEQ